MLPANLKLDAGDSSSRWRWAALATLCALLAACGGGSGGLGSNGATPAGSMPAGGTTAPTGATATPGGGSTAPDGATSPATPAAPVLALPIEVLGTGAPDAPTVAGATLSLDAAAVAAATQLLVQCHRCGFYNAPEFEALAKPVTTVAASMRMVGGDAGKVVPWIDISDSTVSLDDAERAQGGVNGGLLTMRFRIPIDAATRARLVAAPATNRIEFRFNGTDGNANGFRILDLQVLDATGKNVLTMARTWADISLEKTAGSVRTADADLGQALWNAHGVLQKSSIVTSKMRAACASCHASDGRDLQYFNYSNNAIIQRSRFHGLSDAQGRQIVAYLRASLAGKVPHVPAATPWNPPYQPGPGLDAKPVAEWAAGAGLDAVLADARAFVQVFAGKSPDSTVAVTQVELDAAMDPRPGKVLNTREMRVALQLPDWNAWLPVTHPLDIWTPDAGASAGLFETQGDANGNPAKVFQRDMDWLQANKNPNGVYGDWSHLTTAQREQAQSWLNDLGGSTLAFIGGGRGARVSPDPAKPYGGEIGAQKLMARMSPATVAAARFPAAFTKSAFIERSLFGMVHWMGVKQWELAHTNGLEGRQDWFSGARDASGAWAGVGEKRGWPFSWPSVFYLAPHMLHAPEGTRENYFSWEPKLTSFYRTNQWYQLQMTMNPGWPGASMGPMDWPYHMGFTQALVDELNNIKAPASVTASHLARFFQVRTKLAQLANTNLPFNAPDPADPANLFLNKGIQSRADLANHKLGFGEVVDRGPSAGERTPFRQLDDVQPGLHVKFINSAIALYNTLYADTTYAQWRRCDPNASFAGEPEIRSGFRFCLDASRTPLPLNSVGQPHLVGGWVDWTTEQYINWSIISAGNHGADPVRLKTSADWYQRMWP